MMVTSRHMVQDYWSSRGESTTSSRFLSCKHARETG